MVQVNILNPTMRDLPLRNTEIDFDDLLGGEDFRKKTRLSISVRYMYMLRIPFANWIIHQSYRAQRAGAKLYGALYNAHGDSSDSSMFSKGGHNLTLNPSRMDIDRVITRLAAKGVYMVPLRAQYTMRMQSNPYRVSLMTQAPPDN
jgi:hypothetical protein